MDLKIFECDYSCLIKNEFFIEYTKKINEVQSYDCYYYSNYKQGIEFILNNERELICIHVFGKKHKEYGLFNGLLPFDISLEDSKPMVYKKFGALQIAKGGGEIEPIFGKINYWMKIKIDEYTIRFEFKEEDVVLITFAKVE